MKLRSNLGISYKMVEPPKSTAKYPKIGDRIILGKRSYTVTELCPHHFVTITSTKWRICFHYIDDFVIMKGAI